MRTKFAAAATCGLALALGACGSSNSSSSSGSQAAAPASPYGGGAAATTKTAPAATPAAASVSLAADPSGRLAFDKSQATAKAGRVTLVFRNPAPIQHGISVQGNGLDKDGKVIGQGSTTTLSVVLKPGTYTFYCPVPGHRQAGMQGKLVVQ